MERLYKGHYKVYFDGVYDAESFANQMQTRHPDMYRKIYPLIRHEIHRMYYLRIVNGCYSGWDHTEHHAYDKNDMIVIKAKDLLSIAPSELFDF